MARGWNERRGGAARDGASKARATFLFPLLLRLQLSRLWGLRFIVYRRGGFPQKGIAKLDRIYLNDSATVGHGGPAK